MTPVSSNTALEACGAFCRDNPHQDRLTSCESPRCRPRVTCRSWAMRPMAASCSVPDVMLNRRNLAALRTRDAVTADDHGAVAARDNRCAVSELVAAPSAAVSLSATGCRTFDVADCRALLEKLAQDASGFHEILGAHHRVASLDLTDGVRASLDNGAIVHLRLSGNAPELRCYPKPQAPRRPRPLCRTCLSRVPG